MIDEHTESRLRADDAQDAYVAFVDILGFSNQVLSNFEFVVQVYDEILRSSGLIEKLRPDVSFQVFSDAFVLSSPSLKRLVGAVQGLLMQTLLYDCLVRGGIGFGRHIEKAEAKRSLIVSQALIRAVRTEKLIKYPCVALDPEIVIEDSWWLVDTPNLHRGLLYFDGLRIVNPCNLCWGQSAGVRVLQLKKGSSLYHDKYDWFLRLHEAIFSDIPLIPPQT